MTNLTNAENFLYELLDCDSPAELRLLDDVKYDWTDVLNQLDGWLLEEINLNNLMRAVVSVGIIELRDKIDERVEELEAQDKTNDDEKAELEALQTLDPDQDIDGYFNCLDTHVFFKDNEDSYRQYMADAVESFEDNTGLKFSV